MNPSSCYTVAMHYDLLVIGGGAAGIFAALIAKEFDSTAKVLVCEKSSQLLSKVKISGGGRCNVTHGCFDPITFSKNYPRGNKELIGAFHRFQAKDMIDWLEKKGVVLKKESDGRMFPVTDCSSTIIDCFLKEAENLQVEIKTKQTIKEISKEEDIFLITKEDGTILKATNVLIATGSHPSGHQLAKALGHQITFLCASLFAFNLSSSPLHELSGISIPSAKATLVGTHLSQQGPILITHFGLSGPAIIKLSAWGAEHLASINYKGSVKISWIGSAHEGQISELLLKKKQTDPQKLVCHDPVFECPKRFWNYLCSKAMIDGAKKWVDLSSKEIKSLISMILYDEYPIEGKTTHKEEFVTSGGVCLKQVDIKTMQSKVCKGLFFAGEVLNIDGITGGFNFQNAWSTGFIAAQHAMSKQ